MSAKLQATKNYSLFEVSEFNRSVEKTKKLEESMKKHGYIPAYPMHVYRNGNGKLKIKAGHHRFETAKKLGLPAHYIICEDSATIFELEKSTTSWKLADYLEAYCRLGLQSYLTVADYHASTGINLSQAVSLLSGESGSSSNHTSFFKSGTFEIKGQGHANAVAKIVNDCRELKVVFAASRSFVSAISLVLFLDEFDPATFIHKVEVNPFLLRKQATVPQYLELIEQIYNFKNQYKVNIAFLAKEAAFRRSAIAKNKKPS